MGMQPIGLPRLKCNQLSLGVFPDTGDMIKLMGLVLAIYGTHPFFPERRKMMMAPQMTG